MTDMTGKEIVEAAHARTGTEKKQARGWNWVCYCQVCCAIRARRKSGEGTPSKR